MIVPVGPSQIRFRGRLIDRKQGFVALQDIRCPDRHRLRLGGMVVRGDAGLTCTNKAHAGAGECGAIMWLLYLPGGSGLRRFYVADVEYQELLRWEREHYAAEDILRYLGAWFTRGDVPPDGAQQRWSA